MSGIILQILISILSGLLASIIAIVVWEWIMKPALEIEICKKVENKEPAIDSNLAYYHMQITNYGCRTANNCRVEIRLKDINTEETLFSYFGKWDKNPRPLLHVPIPIKIKKKEEIETQNKPVFQEFIISDAETINIGPDSSEKFALLIKYDGESECYGFNSWSYNQEKFKDKNMELGRGEYILEIELNSSSKKLVKKFLLLNVSNRLDDIEIQKIK